MFHAESGCSLGTHWRCSISWEMAFDLFGGAIRCKMYVVFMMETGIAKRSFEDRALYLLLSYCWRLFVVISFVVLLLWICFGYLFEKKYSS